MSLIRNVRTFIGLAPEEVAESEPQLVDNAQPSHPLGAEAQVISQASKAEPAGQVRTGRGRHDIKSEELMTGSSSQSSVINADGMPFFDNLSTNATSGRTTKRSDEIDLRDGKSDHELDTNPITTGGSVQKRVEVSPSDNTEQTIDQPVPKSTASSNPKKTSRTKVVRSIASQRSRPRLIVPTDFAEAKDIADEFKRDIPVVINLNGLERQLSRRLIDFCSGLCYGQGATMEKVSRQVFLLIPNGVEISDRDRRQLESRSYAR